MVAINNALTRFESDLILASEGLTIAAPKRLAFFICRRLLATEKPSLAELAMLYDSFLLHFEKMVVEQNKTAPTTLESLSIHWQIITRPTGEVAKIINQWSVQMSVVRQREGMPPLPSNWDLGINCTYITTRDGEALYQKAKIDCKGLLHAEEFGNTITDALGLAGEKKWGEIRGIIQKHQRPIPFAIGLELLSQAIVQKERESSKELLEAGVPFSEEAFSVMIREWHPLDIFDTIVHNELAICDSIFICLVSRYKESELSLHEWMLLDALCRKWMGGDQSEERVIEFYKKVLIAAREQKCSRDSIRQLELKLWAIARDSPCREAIIPVLQLAAQAAYDCNLLKQAFKGQISEEDLSVLAPICSTTDYYSVEIKKRFGSHLSVGDLCRLLTIEHICLYSVSYLGSFSVDDIFQLLEGVQENFRFAGRLKHQCGDLLTLELLRFLVHDTTTNPEYPILSERYVVPAMCTIVSECLGPLVSKAKKRQMLVTITTMFTLAARDCVNMSAYSKKQYVKFITKIPSEVAIEFLHDCGFASIAMFDLLTPAFIGTDEGVQNFKKLALSADPLLAAHVYGIAKDVGVALAYTELIAKSPLRVQLEHAIAEYDALSLQRFYCRISELASDELEVALLQVLSAK